MSGMSAPVSTKNLTDWWQRNHVAHQPSGCVCTRGGVCGSIESLREQIALRTGLSRSTLYRRIQAGHITMAEADQWAVALGVSPYTIWHGFDRAPVVASLSALTTPYAGRLF